MKETVITVDSAADIPADIAEKFGIKIMPMYIVKGGKALRDGVDITARDIFDEFDKTGALPKTSAVSPGEYLKFFGEFRKRGKAVVHLSFCSKLSSTHRNAKIASARLGDVYVLDTDNLGGGVALPALKGCKMRDSGASAEEIYTELDKLRGKVRVSYLLDNISFLRAGGRCSAAAAFGSGLLSIRPCAAMIDGKIEVIKKYRGKSKAVRLQYASEQLEKYKNIDFETAFIYHACVPDDELAVVADMLRDAGFKRVIIADEGCMIGLHSAKGALGIHFIAD